MSAAHNLDESLKEYFEFIVNGHRYRFRHMTTEEAEIFFKMGGNDNKSKKYLLQFIDKVDKDAPDFEVTLKKMIIPQWRRFSEMLVTEFKG